ncbi:hypothetical protein ES703_58886 [subsurface metagenome]
MTGLSQVDRRLQSAWSGSDDGHLLSRRRLNLNLHTSLTLLLQLPVGQPPLDVLDGYGFIINLLPFASLLAWMGADASGHTGKGKCGFVTDERERLLILTYGYRGHVAVRVEMHRACCSAGRLSLFIYGELVGHGLFKRAVGGLS